MEEPILISVIVPAYNAEKYIKRCLDTLLTQTYKQLEIIVVDDGSTDGTSFLCDEYKRRDKRIIVIHKSNGGLSSARNTGIRIATGDYLFFLDSDDWLDLDYFEKCVKELETEAVDLLFTPYIKEYNNNSIKVLLFDESRNFPTKKEVSYHVHRRLFGPFGNEKSPEKLENFNTAWGKFYKRNIIGDSQFASWESVGTAEDLCFNIQVLFNVSSAKYYDKVFLHYNKTNTTSLVSVYHSEQSRITENVYEIMETFIVQNQLPDEYIRALKNRIVIGVFSRFFELGMSDLKFEEKKSKLANILSNKRYVEARKDFSYEGMKLKWILFYKLIEYKCITLLLLCVSVLRWLRLHL